LGVSASLGKPVFVEDSAGILPLCFSRIMQQGQESLPTTRADICL